MSALQSTLLYKWMMAFSIVSILPFILVVTSCISIGQAQPGKCTVKMMCAWDVLSACGLVTSTFLLAVILSLGSITITINNTEILITDIGQDASGGLPSLTCHTDLTACCRNGADNNGNGRLGQWTYPDRNVILNYYESYFGGNFYTRRNAAQLVRLNRKEATNPLSPTGSYCCTIPTTGGDMTLCANLGKYIYLIIQHYYTLSVQSCVHPSFPRPMVWSHTLIQHWVKGL